MKNNKLVLLSILAMAITGCNQSTPGGSSSTTKDQVELTDMIGRKVEIDRNAIKKVVCIGAGALRLYSYVGDIQLISGVEDIDRSVNANRFEGAARPYYDLHKEYFATLPSVGIGGPMNQFAEPEKIIEAEPDLIISEYEDVKKADDLQKQLKTPVLVVSYGGANVFGDTVKNSIELLGKALKRESRASELNQYIATCKTELTDKVKDVKEEDQPTFYIGCLGNWGRQSFLSTSKQYPAFSISKIKNAAKDLTVDDKGNIDLEKLIDVDPDKIILDAAGIDLFKEEYKKSTATYDVMKAFSNDELYLEMAFNAYYTNLEIALMNCYYVASLAYPTLYEGFDIASKSNEITNAFLGKEMYNDIKAKQYSYGGYQQIKDLATFGE